ncbi:MAG: hypothetical protein ACRDPO_34100 [Streptosporangiaceae bacterium]
MADALRAFANAAGELPDSQWLADGGEGVSDGTPRMARTAGKGRA